MIQCNINNNPSGSSTTNMINTNTTNTNTNDDYNSSVTISEKLSCFISSSSNDDGVGVGVGGFIISASKITNPIHTISCPSCGHHVPLHHHQASGVNDLPGLPAGVKFDPTDPEILGHLEAKVRSNFSKLHPLLDEFIPTIQGQNGICYTHPEKLPGVSKDGIIRHYFHCPSKAYTTGTRKRRKVHTDEDGGETRWHKTGKTRPILVNGEVKGFKKILVLYTNYGRQRKAEKTNWVMHQYHLGENEEENDGEFVLSKVFYQTQPRQCGSNMKETIDEHPLIKTPQNFYQPHYVSYDHGVANRVIPNMALQGDGSSYIQLSDGRK